MIAMTKMMGWQSDLVAHHFLEWECRNVCCEDHVKRWLERFGFIGQDERRQTPHVSFGCRPSICQCQCFCWYVASSDANTEQSCASLQSAVGYAASLIVTTSVQAVSRLLLRCYVTTSAASSSAAPSAWFRQQSSDAHRLTAPLVLGQLRHRFATPASTR